MAGLFLDHKRLQDGTPSSAEDGDVAILDGGLASELEARGHDLADRLWSARLLLEDPAAIAAIHRAYAHSGADIVCTATYQASQETLASRGLDAAAAARLLAEAVELCRSNVPAAVVVAASLGSFGARFADGSEYSGDFSASTGEIAAFHERRVGAVAAADLLAFETIPCLLEARAIESVLTAYPGREAWVSFSCRDGQRVCHGESIEDCVRAVPSATCVGVNCTAPDYVEELVTRIHQVTDRPIVAYPNVGRAWDPATRSWQGSTLSPQAFAQLAQRLRHRGARIIGGCCGTTPDHIAALRRVLAPALDC